MCPLLGWGAPLSKGAGGGGGAAHGMSRGPARTGGHGLLRGQGRLIREERMGHDVGV